MLEELEVLRAISQRLETADIPFMLTGSFAMAYYSQPRMTRDLDLVVALNETHVDRLVAMLSADFYIDPEDVLVAVRSQRMFNLMHFASAIRVDVIVREESEYRQLEFAHRRPVTMNGIGTWIVSREDLILSKLLWANDTHSDLQLRDVRNLLDGDLDRPYLEQWALTLGIVQVLKDLGT